jgi:hypothetical protein
LEEAEEMEFFGAFGTESGVVLEALQQAGPLLRGGFGVAAPELEQEEEIGAQEGTSFLRHSRRSWLAR